MTPNHLGFFLVTIAKHLTARAAKVLTNLYSWQA